MFRSISNTKNYLLLGTIALGMAANAHAGLIGATVDVTADYPEIGSILADGGNQIVSGAIEYPAGSFDGYGDAWQVDITDTQLILTNTAVGFPFGSADFNGFVLKIISGPAILSASVDPGSDFSPIGISVVNGNEIDLNYTDVTHSNSASSSSIIDITEASPVPEPSSFLVIAGAALALAGAAKRGAARPVR